MSVMVPLYVHTSSFLTATTNSAATLVANRRAALRSRVSDRGASALEYVGLILIAAFVLGIMYTVFNNLGLDTKIKAALNQILTGPNAGTSTAPTKTP